MTEAQHRPRAAIGPFPYPHRTVAELIALGLMPNHAVALPDKRRD